MFTEQPLKSFSAQGCSSNLKETVACTLVSISLHLALHDNFILYNIVHTSFFALQVVYIVNTRSHSIIKDSVVKLRRQTVGITVLRVCMALI